MLSILFEYIMLSVTFLSVVAFKNDIHLMLMLIESIMLSVALLSQVLYNKICH
jgi:hypothetical protein